MRATTPCSLVLTARAPSLLSHSLTLYLSLSWLTMPEPWSSTTIVPSSSSNTARIVYSLPQPRSRTPSPLPRCAPPRAHGRPSQKPPECHHHHATSWEPLMHAARSTWPASGQAEQSHGCTQALRSRSATPPLQMSLLRLPPAVSLMSSTSNS
jgi:hypothetical protein